MSGTEWGRWIAGGLLLAVLAGGGAAMLNLGVYGWSLFVLGPALIGGVAAWMFRAKTNWQS